MSKQEYIPVQEDSGIESIPRDTEGVIEELTKQVQVLRNQLQQTQKDCATYRNALLTLAKEINI